MAEETIVFLVKKSWDAAAVPQRRYKIMASITIKGLVKKRNGVNVLDRFDLEAPANAITTLLYNPAERTAIDCLFACLSGEMPTAAGRICAADGPGLPTAPSAIRIHPPGSPKPGAKMINHCRRELANNGVQLFQRGKIARAACETFAFDPDAPADLCDPSEGDPAMAFRLALATQSIPRNIGAVLIDLDQWSTLHPADILQATQCLQDPFAAVIGCTTHAATAFQADRLCPVANGRGLDNRPPLHVYRRPTGIESALLTGTIGSFNGTIEYCGAGEAILQTTFGSFRGAIEADATEGTKATALVRPEAWHIDTFPPDENCFGIRLITSTFCGAFTSNRVCLCSDESTTFEIWTANQPHGAEGFPAEIYAWVEPEAVTIVELR